MPNRVKPTVLIVGDLVMDRYRVDGDERHRMGCAGNIFGCIDHERFDCHLYSGYADPALARDILRRSGGRGGIVVSRADGVPNRVDYSFDGDRVVQERDAPAGQPVQHDLTRLAELIDRSDILVICDHRLGTLSGAVRALLRAAAGRFAHSYVDCRFGNFADYRGMACIFPNPEEYELLRAGGRTLVDGEDVRRFGFEEMFRKRGSEGVTWIAREKAEAVPCPYAPIVDDFGAGDYLIAEIINAHGPEPHCRSGIDLAVKRTVGRLALVGGGLLADMGGRADATESRRQVMLPG